MMKRFAVIAGLCLVFAAHAQNVTSAPNTSVPLPTPLPPTPPTPQPTPLPTVAPPTPQPTVAPPTMAPIVGCLGDPTPVLVVVITKLGVPNSAISDSVLSQAVPSHITRLISAQAGCALSYLVIDSQGSSTTALSAYRDEIVVARGLTDNNSTSQTRVVVIVLDNVDVTLAVQSALPSSIPIVSSWTSDTSSSDALVYQSVLRFMPSSKQLFAALLAASNAFKWDSVAIVYSSTQYGSYLASGLQSSFLQAGNSVQAPVVVANVPLPSQGSATGDDAVLQQLAQNNPVAVICFVTDAEFARLTAARTLHNKYNDIISNFFFLGTMDSLDQLMDKSSAIAPPFPGPSSFADYVPQQSGFSTSGRLRLAALFDSLRVVSVAMRGDPTQTFINRLLQVSFSDGLTGPVGFDATTMGRSDAATSFNFVVIGVNAAGSWTPASGFISTGVTNVVVPKSPLKTVTVCLLSTSACYDTANVNYIMFGLTQANRNNPFMVSNGAKFQFVTMNTGDDAVQGMRLLLQSATLCNFITGSGRSSVDFALTPIVNSFTIPQIDYEATSVTLSDKVRYPFFSRVVATDSPVAQVFASVAAAFQWDRISLLTTADEYGTTTTAAVTTQMATKLVDIEQVFTIPMTYKNSFAAGGTGGADFSSMFVSSLTYIRDVLISRVVLVMVPCSQQMAVAFFQTVVNLGMNNTHIFLLESTLCQVANAYPALRAPLLGSVCLSPFRNASIFNPVVSAYNAMSAADHATFTSLLSAGQFDTSTCDASLVDIYSPYAYDTAQVIINVVQRALTTGIPLTNGTALTQLIRSTAMPFTYPWTSAPFVIPNDQQVSVTGNLTFAPTGDRTISQFTVNVQQRYPQAVVEFASWSSTGRYQLYDDSQLPYGPLLWFDNTSAIPKVTIRSIKFIASTTVSLHPGTILISIFGFLLTIGVFAFCYKAQKFQYGETHESQYSGVAAPEKQN